MYKWIYKRNSKIGGGGKKVFEAANVYGIWRMREIRNLLVFSMGTKIMSFLKRIQHPLLKIVNNALIDSPSPSNIRT